MIMRLGFVLLIAAAGCWIAWHMIGPHVDEDGILREPFYLLGGGWIFLSTGSVLLLSSLFARRR